HARGELVTFDPRGERVVSHTRLAMTHVQLLQQRPAGQLGFLRDVLCGEQVVQRNSAAAEWRPLMPGGKKAVRPVDRSPRRKSPRIGNDDERRQTVGFVSQSVAQPRSEDGKTIQ